MWKIIIQPAMKGPNAVQMKPSSMTGLSYGSHQHTIISLAFIHKNLKG